MIRVYAKQLQAGDVTFSTGETILKADWISGDKKVKLQVMRRDGSVRSASWNAYTKIGVMREVHV